MHNSIDHRNKANTALLRSVLPIQPLADIIYSRLARDRPSGCTGKTMIAIPKEWQTKSSRHRLDITYYADNRLDSPPLTKMRKPNHWLVISNGRFITNIDSDQFPKALNDRQHLIAVNVDPALQAYHEKVVLASNGNVAGFKRVYSNSLLPGFLGDQWPHHVFVRPALLADLLVDGALPLDFSEFLNACSRRSFQWNCLNIGGSVIDLETETGMLHLLTASQRLLRHIRDTPHNNNSCNIAGNARFFGDVLITGNVRIGENAIIVGPAILGDDVKIGSRVIVKSSIIAPNLSIPDGSVIQDRVLTKSSLSQTKQTKPLTNPGPVRISARASKGNYRSWPLLSYARCGKRIKDLFFSSIILLLFAPVFPVIALSIKLNSPGPVFFGHKRQGLHGRPFKCLKFRTMIVGAVDMQHKLMSRNHVDGPQFKITDDPRVTTVGRFLRNTYIDEIPQFINVLLGQMSIVGPRPSPEAENQRCHFWHDARLSVRPGLTGLWQMHRTRQPGRDFQEWVHYDTQYVRNMSLRQDLSLCWMTARKLIANFIDQF